MTHLTREEFSVLFQKVVRHGIIATDDYCRVQESYAALLVRVEEVNAMRSIEHNSARMLAQYVVHHLTDAQTHDEGETLDAAKGFLSRDVPTTTPWLLQMMAASLGN